MMRTTKTTSSTAEIALRRVSAYAQAVLDGVEVAGPHVRNACRRHFADLERGHERGLYWDDEAANRVFGSLRSGFASVRVSLMASRSNFIRRRRSNSVRSSGGRKRTALAAFAPPTLKRARVTASRRLPVVSAFMV